MAARAFCRCSSKSPRFGGNAAVTEKLCELHQHPTLPGIEALEQPQQFFPVTLHPSPFIGFNANTGILRRSRIRFSSLSDLTVRPGC